MTRILVCQRRPSDPTEVVCVMVLSRPKKGMRISRPSADFKWPEDTSFVLVDPNDDWGTWVETQGYDQRPPVMWWSVWGN